MSSPTANGAVRLTNPALRIYGDRNIWVWDNPNSQTDKAVIHGRLWDWRLYKYGPGLLELTNQTGGTDFNWMEIRWGGVYIGNVNGNGTGGPLNGTFLRFTSHWWDQQRGEDQDEYGVLLANGSFTRKIIQDNNQDPDGVLLPRGRRFRGSRRRPDGHVAKQRGTEHRRQPRVAVG